MAWDSKLTFKLLSPRMMVKAMQTFDRATTVVVSICWGAVAFMMAAAIYTLTLSISTRHAADTALVVEPNLPKIVHKPMDIHSVQTAYDRMQHRFPDIAFSVHGQALLVASTDGTKFRQWLMALSYMDTVSPEYHWSIQDFCVGKCPNMEIMHAALIGERIAFETPQSDTKN